MVTPSSEAVDAANEIMLISAELISLYNRIVAVDLAWNDHGVAVLLSNFNTAVLTADGILGAQDPTPVAAHPIVNTNYPPLNRPVTAMQITQMKSAIDDVGKYIGGSAISANPGAHAILNAAVGG
jgi:hypothetical protein